VGAVRRVYGGVLLSEVVAFEKLEGETDKRWNPVIVTSMLGC
jgi:hypothetical protein